MRNYEKGQVLLIVILVMTVALTIGLSVATRTITSLRTTAEEESSQRAFSAAEAGIEQALQDNTNNTGTFANNTTYKTSVETLAGPDFFLNNGVTVLKDEAVDLWLSTYPGYTNPWNGPLTLYWGSSSDVCDRVEENNSMAALEVILISGTKNTPQITRYALDPCASRQAGNRFELISQDAGTVKDKTFAFKRTISPITSGLLMRIIPLYSSTSIAVKGCDGVGGGCNSFPAQGKLVTSTGVSDTAERKIIGFQENPSLPVQIFPFILFSPK
jgi:Tfp pilus assembly protein PilX